MNNYLNSYELLDELDTILLSGDEHNYDLLAYDTETNGLKLHDNLIVGFSLSKDSKGGWYIPFLEWCPDLNSKKSKTFSGKKYEIFENGCFKCAWTGKTYPETVNVNEYQPPKRVVEYMRRWLTGVQLVMHNAPFDVCMTLASVGIDLSDSLYVDTALLVHVINENTLNGLKPTAEEWSQELNYNSKEEAVKEAKELGVSVLENGGDVTKTLRAKSVWRASPFVLGEYAIKDTALTYGVYQCCVKKLTENFTEKTSKWILEEEVMPLCKEVLIDLKYNGVHIDVEHFQKQDAEISQYMLKLEKDFNDAIKPHLIDFKPANSYDSVVSDKAMVEKIMQIEGLKKPTKLNKATGELKETLAKKEVAKAYNENPHWIYGYLLGEDELKYSDAKLLEIKEEIFRERTGKSYEFNLGSDNHLRYLFIESLEMDTKDIPETDSSTKDKPKYSMKAEVLKQHMLPEYPWVKHLLTYKKLKKLHSTYILPALNLNIDGVLYTDYKQNGTSTGRASMGGGYNLQTLPNIERETEALKYCTCGSENVTLTGTVDVIRERNCQDCGLSENIVIGGVIKQGFVAPEGYKFIASDYSSLEPRCFAFMSDDANLLQVYKDGLDLYSEVSLRVRPELQGKYSSNPTDDNFLKKLNPLARKDSKIYTLATPYGASKYQIANLLGKFKTIKIKGQGTKTIPDGDYGQGVIDTYLNAFPNLRKYMANSQRQCFKRGFLESYFGRRRHFPQAKSIETFLNKYNYTYQDLIGCSAYQLKTADILAKSSTGKIVKLSEWALKELCKILKISYYKVANSDYWNYIKSITKNARNSALNFPIQSLAGHLLNRAMIEINREFKKEGIEANIILGVHDEVIAMSKDEDAHRAAEIIKDKMENNLYANQIKVSMEATPIIGTRLDLCK